MVIMSAPSSNKAAFRKLLLVAFLLAMLGLFGNLLHLHSLTTKFKNEPSDLITHYAMSKEHNEALKQQQQLRKQHSNIQLRLQLQPQRRATLEEEANSMSNNKDLLQDPTEQQQNEDPAASASTSLLRRLLRESIDSLEACRRRKILTPLVAATTTTGTTMAGPNDNNIASDENVSRRLLDDTASTAAMATLPRHQRRVLARFGWLNTLTNYLATSSHASVENAPQQQQLQHEECSIPSSQPYCQVQNMSMLVLSQGTDLRRLFVNLLSWLLYSSVADITVLVPTSTWSMLEKDDKYGRRLRDWHDDPKHKVQLIPYNLSLWEGVQAFHRNSAVPNIKNNNNNNNNPVILPSVIVFMNGDIRWRGNDEGLQAGLALWQRYPASIVASNSFPIQVDPPYIASPQLARSGAINSNSSTSTEHGGPEQSIPFCKQQKLQYRALAQPALSTEQSSYRRLDEDQSNEDDKSDSSEQDKEDDPSISSILDMSGLLMHRDYLCLLSHHHVVQPLARYAFNFYPAQVAMSALLTLASNVGDNNVHDDTGSTQQQHATTIPRLYPLRVVRRQNVSSATGTSAATSSLIQNATVDLSTNGNPQDFEGGGEEEEEEGEEEGEDEVTSESDSRFSRRLSKVESSRRLLFNEDDPKRIDGILSLDDETVTTIFGYFGSIPAKPLPWCSTTNRGLETGATVGTTSISLNEKLMLSCSSVLGDGGEPVARDLAWLRPGSPEHDLCPS